MRGRDALVLVVAVALALAAALASPRLVPYSMDEFVHYHALGCAAYPFARESKGFVEGCGAYDLRPPFTAAFLPLRSYLYIGSFPALPFYPFWRLFQDPVAARAQGAVFFLLATLLLARLARVEARRALLAALFFPLFFSAFLVDLGPVGLSVVLLLGALVTLRAAFEASSLRRAATFGAGAGTLLFLGLWVKLVFAWTLPAVALFALAGAIQARPRLRALAGAATATALAFALPAALLLFSTDRDGQPYYRLGSEVESALRRGRLLKATRHLGAYLLDGSSVLSHVIRPRPAWLDHLPLLAGAALLTWTLACSPRRHAAGAWLAAAALTFAVTASVPGVWGPHHLVFSLVFLSLAMAVGLEALAARRPRTFAALAGLVLLCWLSLVSRLPSAAADPASGFAKDRLLSALRASGLQSRTVEVHASWGTFYLAHLFGARDKLALYVPNAAHSREELERVGALARRLERGVVLVSSDPRAADTPAAREVLGPIGGRLRFEGWTAEVHPRRP